MSIHNTSYVPSLFSSRLSSGLIVFLVSIDDFKYRAYLLPIHTVGRAFHAQVAERMDN